jgi:probable addiction module antidote protein
MNSASIANDDVMIRDLRDDPAYAVEYLRAALEDGDEPAVLMIALRHVMDAYGGVSKLAEAAGIRPEVLYRALSLKGDLTMRTFLAVIKALGMKIEISRQPHAHAELE